MPAYYLSVRPWSHQTVEVNVFCSVLALKCYWDHEALGEVRASEKLLPRSPFESRSSMDGWIGNTANFFCSTLLCVRSQGFLLAAWLCMGKSALPQKRLAAHKMSQQQVCHFKIFENRLPVCRGVNLMTYYVHRELNCAISPFR